MRLNIQPIAELVQIDFSVYGYNSLEVEMEQFVRRWCQWCLKRTESQVLNVRLEVAIQKSRKTSDEDLFFKKLTARLNDLEERCKQYRSQIEQLAS